MDIILRIIGTIKFMGIIFKSIGLEINVLIFYLRIHKKRIHDKNIFEFKYLI